MHEEQLIEQVRAGNEAAWRELVNRFEGRLFAYVHARVKQRQAAEDIVQETFLGLLNSLPNYDGRPLESYLFAICAHKLTDFLRREGRRPPLISVEGSSSADRPPLVGNSRGVSSIARSGERQRLEEQAIVKVLHDLIRQWRKRGDWNKLQCIELLVVRGWSNKRVAQTLGLTEQQVANFKFDFLQRMRHELARAGLSLDVFPELYRSDEPC